MNTFKIFGFLLLIILLALSSCRKDPTWDVLVKTPLLKANLNIDNIVDDSITKVNPDSSVTIAFDKVLFSLPPDSIITIPDSLYYANYLIPLTINVPPGTLVINETKSKYYKMGGAKITDLKFKSGKIAFRVFNHVEGNAYIEYSINNSLFNGSPLTMSGIAPSYINTGETLYKEIDISGLELDLRDFYLHCNAITSTFKVFADPNATSLIPVHANDSINVLIEFKDVVIDYARGYFGNHELNVEDLSELNIFKNIDIEAIDVENVKMNIDVENYFGADASFEIKYLKGIGKDSVALNSNWIGNPINIIRANESPALSGNVNPSSLHLDFSNDNIEEFIENVPKSIKYSVEGKLNPLGNISSGNDFAYSGKGFNATAHIEVPLNIAFTNLALRDTIDFDIEKKDSYINESILYLKINNGFPLSVSFKILLADENNNVLDSILPNANVQAAPIDLSGKVTAPHISNIEIPLNESQTNNLYQSKKAIIKANFNTGSSGEKINIYANYKLLFFISGLFDYQINP